MKSAANPVLAHQFLNYMLDLPNVLENISFNGYMQPLNGVTPQVLVKEQILPRALLSAVVAVLLIPMVYYVMATNLAVPGLVAGADRHRGAVLVQQGQAAGLLPGPIRGQVRVAVYDCAASCALAWVALVVCGGPGPSVRAVAWGLVAGLGSGAGTLALYWGMARGQLSVVGPVSAVGAAVVPIAVGVALGERPSVPGRPGPVRDRRGRHRPELRRSGARPGASLRAPASERGAACSRTSTSTTAIRPRSASSRPARPGKRSATT